MSPRTRRRLRWWAVATVTPLALSVLPASASPAPGAVRAASSCTEEERTAALKEEQRRVMTHLEPFRTLWSERDLERLGQPNTDNGTAYNFLDHRFASAHRMGIGIVDTIEPPPPQDPVEPGFPDVLLYAPDPGADDVLDPDGPDFPYRLAGWAYTPGTYDYDAVPTALECLGRGDWFVHERSIHPADTWQNIAVPPLLGEEFQGEEDNELPITPAECAPAPCPPGIQHPRIWDIHIWLGGGQVPTVSILRPGRPIRGWDPAVGTAFFYPPLSRPVPGARHAS